MDKPISEWKRRFRGMEARALENAWSAKADDDVSWVQQSNFHAAVAQRFKQIGNMAIDLDEGERKTLCHRGNAILHRLELHLRGEPHKWAEVQQAVSEEDAYFAQYGSKTARYYMYEQGVIDELGDRQPGR